MSMVSIFLIGVFHEIQADGPQTTPRQRRFMSCLAEYLVRQIRFRHIDLVAEEYSQYIERRNNVTCVTARSAAERCGVAHRYLDPGMEDVHDRREMSDLEREKYWLNLLDEEPFTVALILVGDGHIRAFSKLLREAGHKVEILKRRVGEGVRVEVEIRRWLRSNED